MNAKALFWTIILFSISLIGCNNNECKTIVLQGDRQGTYYRITYITDDDIDVQRRVDSVFDLIDSNFNLWDKESLIVKINNGDSSVVITDMFETVFKRSQEVSKATDGAFDISVGALTDAWGFGADGVTKDDIDKIKRSIGYEKIRINNGKFYRDNDSIRLTMNAIAQGYTVDVMRDVFDGLGLKNYLIDVGGELFGRGTKIDGTTWRVGVESPSESKDDIQKIAKIVPLKDMAIVTSGNYRKYVEKDGVRYSHTIDPRTQKPVSNKILSATVYADNATDADAYATAFMVMGVEKALSFLNNRKDMEAFFIYANEKGEIQTACTAGFEKLIMK